MEKIIPKFRESIFSGVSSVIPDIAELGIDSFLDDGVLKDLPFVGIFLGAKNVVQNLYDRNLMRQTLVFIKELNSGNLDEKKKQKYKKKIENDTKKAEDELGRVLLILNRTVDVEKTCMLARLFTHYINEDISWDQFRDYTEVVERLFLSDIAWLGKLYNHNIKGDDYMVGSSVYNANRLASIGLVGLSNVASIYKKNYGMGSFVALTKFGKEFYELAVGCQGALLKA